MASFHLIRTLEKNKKQTVVIDSFENKQDKMSNILKQMEEGLLVFCLSAKSKQMDPFPMANLNVFGLPS